MRNSAEPVLALAVQEVCVLLERIENLIENPSQRPPPPPHPSHKGEARVLKSEAR